MLERQWGEGAVQGSSFIGFKSAWQFLETGSGWECDYPSSSRWMSPSLAFVTDHPASGCPDYCTSSIMDRSEGQEGTYPNLLFFSCRVHRTLDFTNQNMNGFLCLLIGRIEECFICTF